jgi:hypothetical protein
LKRNVGNEGGWQTCLSVKNIFDSRNCVVDFTIKCDNNYDISVEEAKEKYAKAQQR